jgi:hypothetical protein
LILLAFVLLLHFHADPAKPPAEEPPPEEDINPEAHLDKPNESEKDVISEGAGERKPKELEHAGQTTIRKPYPSGG